MTADTGTTTTDRQAVEDVLYRYASSVDAGDHSTLRTLLADDMRAKYGSTHEWLEGADAVVEFIRTKAEGVGWQHHLLSIYHVDITGDEASALTYHTSYQIKSESPDQAAVIVARYHDRLVRVDGVWRLSEKLMEIGWRETRTGMSFF